MRIIVIDVYKRQHPIEPKGNPFGNPVQTRAEAKPVWITVSYTHLTLSFEKNYEYSSLKTILQNKI